MQQNQAEIIALKALEYVIATDEVRDIFLGSSGLAPQDLLAGAGDAAFLSSVLDFICKDDQWVIGFCDIYGFRYTDPLQAMHALPGGEQVNWT